MKNLLIIIALLVCCSACEDLELDADSFRAENRKCNCVEESTKRVTCQKALKNLRTSCDKTSTVNAERPNAGTDYVGNCLWAMDRVYGERFPIGEHINTDETRPGFFFECLKHYPDYAMEEYCCYKLERCKSEVKDVERTVRRVREQCNDYCGNRAGCDCW